MAKKAVDLDTQLLAVGEKTDLISRRRCLLEIVSGSNKGKKFNLNKGTVTAGKSEKCDLKIEDKTVSRNHFEIKQSENSFLLRDLGSTNGTYINDMKVKEAYLSPSDVIRVGNTRIGFLAFDEKVQVEPSDKESFGDLTGQSKKMRQIFGILEKISPTNATVIIEGETGTGKEVVARSIHMNSKRKNKPFVVFDAGAVAENLVESELFGHVKGAFTGAISTRKGAFEEANGGTIFLDEMGELSLELQPKLLRALEQRQVKKVGSNDTTNVDVRVICATNRNLKKEITAGNFREDLYYRLSVVKITLPSLAERPDDIEGLVGRLLAMSKFNQTEGGKLKVTKVDDEALKLLMRYQWPGNVRELMNVLERIVPLSTGDTITGRDVSLVLQELENEEDENTERLNIVDTKLPFKEAKQKIVEDFERDYLATLLRRNHYNISKTAREAGIDRKHIRNLLNKYGILDSHDE